MSAGFSILKKICEQGSRTYFRQLVPDHFAPDERPCYDYVAQHYRLHGQLPTNEALLDHGFQLNRPDIRTNENADYYLERMRNRHIVLAARQRSEDLRQAIVTGAVPVISEAVADLHRVIRQTAHSSSVSTMSENIVKAREMYEVARTHPGIQGITFGYPWLDEITGGAQPGDIITLAARTGLGKSYFLNQMALGAWLQGSSILMVSMEMTCVQMVTRMIGQYTGISPDHIRRGTMSWDTRQRFYAATEDMMNAAPFTLVDGSFSLKAEQIDALVQEFNPDIVYVDASYLLTPPETRFSDKGWERQRELSKELKRLAMTRQKPVFQTVQLNKDAVRKSAAELDVGMIGGTDGIAQDSTTIFLLAEGPPGEERTKRDLLVAKNREGQRSWMRTHFLFDPINLDFIGDESAFANLGPTAIPGVDA